MTPQLHCRETRGANQASPWSHTRSPESKGQLYSVRIIDNNVNTYEQVITITMRALGLTFEQAYSVAWTVDHEGSCQVCVAEEQEASRIANVIRTIGIEVEVEKWFEA